jgi:FlaA1/EpsC-like NDP-sugar epimerase
LAISLNLSGVRSRWRLMLLELPRYTKRALLVLMDLGLLGLALWGSISLRYGEYYVPDTWGATLLLIAGPLITVGVFGWIGLYRLVTRYISYRGTLQIFAGVATSVMMWSLLVFMSGQLGVPRSSILLYGFVAAAFIALSRQAAGMVLKSAGIAVPTFVEDRDRKPVLIYGAGPMGVQLLQSLRGARDREAIGFIDDQPTLWGQYISGVKVYRPDKLEHMIRRQGAREVLLALPGSHRRERRQILQELEKYQVEVKVLPAYEDLASGRVGVQDLRPVDVGELLGRDPVQPNPELLARNTRGKSILVTGAGGSIGSELVRQILKQHPARLVLLDSSEIALYEIDSEVHQRVSEMPDDLPRPEIISVLGSVLDAAVVSDVMRVNKTETVYHAAAYKHVPIVEHNPIAGLNNNVFGTVVVAECARANNVERVVLISTDKAVRPTNVMGASKRLAELVLQANAADKSNTVFTMVRFGNVLDSSGSVVRRFRKQIECGGPVTVTHKDIERYFMSIPEAAELVVQAGAMATGGEVFVLHMGEPVKIDSLARLMIHLSGLEVRDEVNPQGDISIVYTGLRPGEKLYEELLIGANTTGTEHQRISTTAEPFLTSEILQHELDVLQAAMTARDVEAIQGLLLRTVEGYHPNVAAVRAAEDITGEATWSGATQTVH